MQTGIWKHIMTTTTHKPAVSVIIPTYNHAHLIRRCLESVISQTFTNWEAMVVNNFSEDNTIEVVNSIKDPRIQLVNFKNNGIIAASRNVGIRLARGDYLAFLDSDDWWYPKKLEVMFNYLPNADIAYHDLDIYTQKGKRSLIKMWGRKLEKPVFRDLMLNKNALVNSSVVVKKNIISELGGLSEDRSLVSVEDFDLWLRISKITDNFVYIPKSLGAYWMAGGNITEVSERQIMMIKAVYNKHIDFLSDRDREQVKILVSYLIGKIKEKVNLLDEALKLFKISIKSKNFKIKLKSMIFIALIHIQRMRLVM